MIKSASCLALPILLVACGGGGGGGSPSVIAPNTTINYSGTSVSVPYSGVNIGTPSAISQGASAIEIDNSSGIIQSVSFTSADGNNVSFNRATGDTIVAVTSTVNGFSNPAGTQVALAGYMAGLGFSYQTFGVWLNGTNSAGTVGAASVGTNITAGSSIPTSGTATYTGAAGGVFGNTQYTYFVTANMSATTNFSNRSIAFTTTNSLYSPTLTGVYTSAGGLNLSGTLTYAANTNNFSGTVNSSGQTVMTGNAGGQFYGPAAQEIGGVFAVKNGNIGYIGAFGGKK